MTLTLPSATLAMVRSTVHYDAKLWRIIRADGVQLRVTDHDTPITFEDLLYEVDFGLNATASEARPALRPRDREARGEITSAAITDEDLQFGRYRGARIEERVVDWRFPDSPAALIRFDEYDVVETSWDGEKWTWQIESRERALQVEHGSTHTRNCQNDLGDGFNDGIGCGVDLGSLTFHNREVDSVEEARRVIRFSIGGVTGLPGGLGDDYFQLGSVVWTTGDNVGHTSEIRTYDESNHEIAFFRETPRTISVGDRCNVVPGCDKIRPTCTTRYNQLVDYKGFPQMRGTKGVLQKLG